MRRQRGVVTYSLLILLTAIMSGGANLAIDLETERYDNIPTLTSCLQSVDEYNNAMKAKRLGEDETGPVRFSWKARCVRVETP